VRFTDDSADKANTGLQEGGVTGLDLSAIEARANTYRGYYWGPFNPYPVFDDVPQLVARVRAQEELIAELELDKKRLDVLEALDSRSSLMVSGGNNVAAFTGHEWKMFPTLREAADALLTTRTPEHEEKSE
jgi:hypothetical protein